MQNPTAQELTASKEESQLVTFLLKDEEFGFDIAAEHKNIAAWLDRIRALPGWEPPYELMPGHPLPS